MLTYETLRKVVYDERSSTSLTGLPKDFFEQARAYMKGKEKLKKDSPEAWEYIAAKRLLQDVLEIRERKLLMAASYAVRSGVVPKDMTAQEKEFLEQVIEVLKSFQQSRNANEDSVELLQNVPQFVAPDMKTYGPFKKGQRVRLPPDVELLFLEKGMIRKRQEANL